MRKGSPNSIYKTLFAFGWLFLFSSTAGAQGVSCIDQITITLQDNCTAPFTPDLALTGSGFDPADYRIRVAYPDGTVSENEVTTEGTFDFLALGPNDFACLGRITAEDKSPPIISDVFWATDSMPLFCSDLDSIYNNPASVVPSEKYYTGHVAYVDGCDPEPRLSFSDNLVYGGCQDSFFVRLERTFRITDRNGFTTDTLQHIFFQRLEPASLVWPERWKTYSCQLNEAVEPTLPVPVYVNAFGDSIPIDQISCDLSYSPLVDTFPVCDRLHKMVVQHVVFDWCTNSSLIVGTTEWLYGDFRPPAVFSTRDTTTVSTSPFDCKASVNISPEGLRALFGWQAEDCGDLNPDIRVWSFLPANGVPGGDSSWQEMNYPKSGEMISDLPTGRHALLIQLLDGCGGQAKDTLYLRVEDRISPLAQCIDDITVSLSTGGFARLLAADANEGSSDACSEVSLSVRREVSDDCIGFFLINGYDLNGDNRINEADGFLQVDGRLFTPWADDVPFFCCDLQATVRVELRAIDASGNEGICWFPVTVEDKRPPLCRPPNPLEITCQDERLGNWNAFGVATILQNDCGNMNLEELPVASSLDQCGIGTIIRSFQVVRDAGTAEEKRSPVCNQTITVVPNHQYSICFPPDVEASCGNDPDIPGLQKVDNGCDLTAVSQTDEFFYGTEEPGVCYKIFRTYRVINWCAYDGEMEPVVVSRDWDNWNGQNPTSPEGNNLPGDRGICVIVQRDFSDGFPDTVWYDADVDPRNDLPSHDLPGADDGYYWKVVSGNGNPASSTYYSGNGTVWGNDPHSQNGPDDDQPAFGSNGFWQYTQHVSIYDDTLPILSLRTEKDTFNAISNIDCSAEVSLQFEVADECGLSWEDFTFSSTLDLYSNGVPEEAPFIDVALFPRLLVSGRYPIGQHTLIIKADDGCGNTATLEKRFVVVDRKAPAPICINGLTVTLMPTEPGDSLGPGAAPVFVDNFLASELNDCSGDVSFSMNVKGEPFDPDRDGVVLTCTDIGTVVVDVFAWDAAGNVGSCETYVLVKDNPQRLCRSEAMGSIEGLITTPDMVPVEGVEVGLSGPFSRMQATPPDGLYGFYNLEPGYDYSVLPRLDQDYSNGVSTYDLYLIQQHILGRDPFTEPHQFIAADANRSGFVSVSDMVQLRKLILHIDLDLPENTSWRFLPTDLRFPEPEEAIKASFSEAFNAENLSADTLVADYWAIKIGDLSGDAVANSQQLNPRSGHREIPLFLKNQRLIAGRTYQLPLYLQPEMPLITVQFSLEANADQLDILGLLSSQVNKKEWVVHRQANSLAISSIPQTSMVADTSAFMFLEVRAETTGFLSDMIRLSDRWTPGELVTARGEVYKPQLFFTEVEKTTYQPFRIFPNPASHPVQVEFSPHTMGPVSLTVFDPQGRALWHRKMHALAGTNQWIIPEGALPASGWFQVVLEFGGKEWRQPLLVP